MKIKSFEFNLRELAGSMGDLGTLFPLAIGYMAVCGMDPSGLLIMMGLANVITGLVFRLPVPIEPMKVVAVVAIAQKWSPSMIYACGIGLGGIWLVFGLTGIMTWVAKVTPKSVVRGIQASLGVLLAVKALPMLSTWWILGGISLLIVLALRKNRYAPASIVLVALGITLMAYKGNLHGLSWKGLSIPPLSGFRPVQIWEALLLAGFAQIPLTATNAVIATSSLIRRYWPERQVQVKSLSLSMGIMNLVACSFGGMPMCHGAGGLAGQYYFGARTGGANIIEGTFEIGLGLLFAFYIAGLFRAFPMAIVGAMMFLVGIEMVKFTKDVRFNWELIPLTVTIAVSLLSNMAFGFLAGMALHYVIRIIPSKKTA